MDYDRLLLSRFHPSNTLPAPKTGLAEAVRQVAPLVEKKGDWAALYMLLNERGYQVGYTELCRIIRAEAPEAPQPQKQDIASSEWDTHRRRFPDWQPVGIQYQKFRRHYLIAQEAQNFLFTQP